MVLGDNITHKTFLDMEAAIRMDFFEFKDINRARPTG
jgi:hypothetical protein